MTTTTCSKTCGCSSRSPTPPTATSSRNTTSSSSTPGIDQETLAYGHWQKDNQYANIWTEANLQNWYTDTQWLPRADYYRLGDSFFDNLFTYYTHSGLDYATIHTDVMVNNPNLFAFLPYDPISNTTGTFSSGRFYTNHELDMPLELRQCGAVRALCARSGGGLDGPVRRRAARASSDRARWDASGARPAPAPRSRPGRSTPTSRASS